MKRFNFFCYYICVVIAGFFVLSKGISVFKTVSLPLFIGYVLLSIFIESLVFRVEDNKYASLGYALVLCSITIFPPSIAAMVSFLGAFFSITRIDDKVWHIFNMSFKKHFFNTMAILTMVYLSGTFYHWSNIIFSNINLKIGNINILTFFLTTILYTSIELLIFTLLFMMINHQNFMKNITDNLWVFSNLIAVAPLGLLMSITQSSLGFSYVLIFIAPLVVTRFIFAKYVEVKDASIKIIDSLAKAIEAKDSYTIGHSSRVCEYATSLALKMKLSKKEVERIKTASLLHDIGKLGISDTIINKPGKLTNEEYREMMRHPEIGFNIIKDIKFLKQESHIIRHHHEHYNGKGYPDGIAKSEIPIESAIISVVDAYDAMTSDRAYRKALTRGQALDILFKHSGDQFDPDVVKAFLDMMQSE